MPVVCSVTSINNDESKGYKVGDQRLVLVKKNEQLFLYENMCPHLGINLEYVEDEYLDPNKSFIQCANHGALFKIDTGECVMGPCKGQWLRSIPFSIEDDNVVI